MDTKKIEKLYNIFDQSIQLLQKNVNMDFLDAFIETGDNLLSNQIQVEDGKPDQATQDELHKIYDKYDKSEYTPEEIRQAIQLVLIQANKAEQIQANHQFTPETIGMLFNYIIDNLKFKEDKIKVYDPAVGTGNLFSTILNHFKDKNQAYEAIGVDNDDTLLSVASMATDMEDIPVQLYQQDSISRPVTHDVDLVVSDLPVGYYPIDEYTEGFKTRSTEGHSFVHHLLIERAMNSVKDGGFGLFLVPSNLFQTKEAKSLLSYFNNQVYLQALVNLPSEMFQNKQSQKAILILQKTGSTAKQAEPVLLGEFPKFNDRTQMKSFLDDFHAWAKKSLV